MAFMERQIEQGEYYSVETTEGTCIVPVDVAGDNATIETIADYLSGNPIGNDARNARGELEPLEVFSGWLARLSAPGYLDCTEWGAYESKQEAIDAMDEMYGEEEEEEQAETD